MDPTRVSGVLHAPAASGYEKGGAHAQPHNKPFFLPFDAALEGTIEARWGVRASEQHLARNKAASIDEEGGDAESLPGAEGNEEAPETNDQPEGKFSGPDGPEQSAENPPADERIKPGKAELGALRQAHNPNFPG